MYVVPCERFLVSLRKETSQSLPRQNPIHTLKHIEHIEHIEQRFIINDLEIQNNLTFV
jgi:hypothetical protein